MEVASRLWRDELLTVAKAADKANTRIHGQSQATSNGGQGEEKIPID